MYLHIDPFSIRYFLNIKSKSKDMKNLIDPGQEIMDRKTEARKGVRFI